MLGKFSETKKKGKKEKEKTQAYGA